jgi:hypothetical protein
MSTDVSEVQLAARFMLVSCLSYIYTLKMEALFSSETSIDFHRNTSCYIVDDRTLRIQFGPSINVRAQSVHTKCKDYNTVYFNTRSIYALKWEIGTQKICKLKDKYTCKHSPKPICSELHREFNSAVISKASL